MASIVQKNPVKPPRATFIDEYDSTTTYIGKAKIGADGGDAVWQIRKIFVNGTVTQVLWADGDNRYNNIWDNRTILSYS